MANTSADLALGDITSQLNPNDRGVRTPRSLEDAQQMQSDEDILRYGGKGSGRKFLYGFTSALVGENNAKKMVKKFGDKEQQQKAFDNLYGGEEKKPAKKDKLERIPKSELKSVLEEIKDSLKDISELRELVEQIHKRIFPRDINVGKGTQAQTYRFDPLAPEGKQVTEVNESGLAGSFAGKKETAAVLSKAAYLGNQDLLSTLKNKPEDTETKEPSGKKKVERKNNKKQTVEKISPVEAKEIIKEIRKQFKNTNNLIKSTSSKKQTISSEKATKERTAPEGKKRKFSSLEEYEKYQEEIEKAKEVEQYGGTTYGKKFVYGMRKGLLGDKYARKKAAKNADKDEREKALRLLYPNLFESSNTTPTLQSPEVSNSKPQSQTSEIEPTIQPAPTQPKINPVDEVQAPNISTEPEKPKKEKPKTVTRLDSSKIEDFSKDLKSYKHTDDWSVSGLDTGDNSWWEDQGITPKTSKGIFAGDSKFTALYASGNSTETKFVNYDDPDTNQPTVVFDLKDKDRITSHKAYLSVFDADDFEEKGTGEFFSENAKSPIEQKEITDPLAYIESQGWTVKWSDDLSEVAQELEKKNVKFGAEGLDINSEESTETSEVEPIQETPIPSMEKEVESDVTPEITPPPLPPPLPPQQETPSFIKKLQEKADKLSQSKFVKGLEEKASKLAETPFIKNTKEKVDELVEKAANTNFVKNLQSKTQEISDKISETSFVKNLKNKAKKLTSESTEEVIAQPQPTSVIEPQDQPITEVTIEPQAPIDSQIIEPTISDIAPIEQPTIPKLESEILPGQIEVQNKLDSVIKATSQIPEVSDTVGRIEKRVSPRDITVGKGEDAQTFRFDPLAPEGKQVATLTQSGKAGRFASKKEESSVLSKAAYLGNEDLANKKEQEDARSQEKIVEQPETVKEPVVEPSPIVQEVAKVESIDPQPATTPETLKPAPPVLPESSEQKIVERNKSNQQKTEVLKEKLKEKRNQKKKFASVEEYDKHQEEVEKAKEVMQYGGTTYGKKFVYGLRKGLLGDKYARKKAAKNADKDEREKAFRLLHPDLIEPISDEQKTIEQNQKSTETAALEVQPQSTETAAPEVQPQSTETTAPEVQPQSTETTAPEVQPQSTETTAPEVQPQSTETTAPEVQPQSTETTAPEVQPQSTETTAPEVQPQSTETTAPEVQPTTQVTNPTLQTNDSNFNLDEVLKNTNQIPEIKDAVDRIEKRVSPRDIDVGKGDQAQTYRYDPLAPQGKQVTSVTESGKAGGFASKKDEASVLTKAAYLGNKDLADKKQQQDNRKAESQAQVQPQPQPKIDQLNPQTPEIVSNISSSPELGEVASASASGNASDLTIATPTPEPLAKQETPELEVQAENTLAMEKEKAESQQEDRQEIIDKLKVIDEKLDKIIKKQEEDSSGGGILGGIASALGSIGPIMGAIEAALPALGVAAAGAVGYAVGTGIDKGVESLTGRAASDWTASGVGALTGQNEEGNAAAHAGEGPPGSAKAKINASLKGTGYEMVSPGKYKGPDGKVVSKDQLPPEIQNKIKPGSATEKPKAGTPEAKPDAQSTQATPTPTSTPVTSAAAPAAVAAGAAAVGAAASGSSEAAPQTEAASSPQATPTATPVVPPTSTSQTTGAVTAESKDKKQEQAITKLTTENEALKNEVKALRPRPKPKKPPPPPPPKPPKKEAKKETTVIQIRNVEQSVATYTASIFDHPVVHPGIYKM